MEGGGELVVAGRALDNLEILLPSCGIALVKEVTEAVGSISTSLEDLSRVEDCLIGLLGG